MESKDELKEINVKNCACYYFDDIIRDFDTNFDNILLDEKLHENISVYDISYKTSMGTKPLPIRFNKIDGFIKVHGGDFRHLVLFDYEYFAEICNKIKYFISEKSGTTDSNNHSFQEIRVVSYNSLPIEKILTFQML